MTETSIHRIAWLGKLAIVLIGIGLIVQMFVPTAQAQTTPPGLCPTVAETLAMLDQFYASTGKEGSVAVSKDPANGDTLIKATAAGLTTSFHQRFGSKDGCLTQTWEEPMPAEKFKGTPA